MPLNLSLAVQALIRHAPNGQHLSEGTACEKGWAINGPTAAETAAGGGCVCFPASGGVRARRSARCGSGHGGGGGCHTLPRRAIGDAHSLPPPPPLRQPIGRFLSFADCCPARRPRWRAQPCSRAANLIGAGCGFAVTSGPDVFPGHAPAGVRATPRSDNGESLFYCHNAMEGQGKPHLYFIAFSKKQH